MYALSEYMYNKQCRLVYTYWFLLKKYSVILTTSFYHDMDQKSNKKKKKKKKLIFKISVDSNFTFSSFARMCVSLLPQTSVLNKVSLRRPFCEYFSHFILK